MHVGGGRDTGGVAAPPPTRGDRRQDGATTGRTADLTVNSTLHIGGNIMTSLFSRAVPCGALLAIALATSACSSIVDGTTQEIVVNTSPAGADCAIERQGLSIARVNPTPGAATIEKTKHDITIRCTKDTFHEATYFNKSDVAGATFGNIILGGGIGWAIDSASGADNKYTSPVNITLVPLTEPQPAPQHSPTGDEKKAAADGTPTS